MAVNRAVSSHLVANQRTLRTNPPPCHGPDASSSAQGPAIAQPKVVCHHVAGVGQRHVLKQNGDSRPPSVLNPDPVDGGGEALSLLHEGGQAVTHLSCAAAAIPRPPAPACRRATGTPAGLGCCRSARTSCGLVRSGDIRPAVAGSASARSTGPTGKSSPWPRRQFWKTRTEAVSFSLALAGRSSQGLIFGKAGRRGAVRP